MSDLTYSDFANLVALVDESRRRHPGRAEQLEPLSAKLWRHLLAAQPTTLRFARANHASEASSRARFESNARGADALALVVLNPGKWIDLREGTWSWAEGRLTWQAKARQPTIGAINESIKAFLRRIRERNPALAKALSFADGRKEEWPGLHLRALPDGTVQAMWRPRPGMKVDGTSPP